MRPLASGKGARRGSYHVSATAVKAGMLGALATATIAAPLGAAAADQGVAPAAPVDAGGVHAANVVNTSKGEAMAPLTLPAVQDAAPEAQYADAASTGTIEVTAAESQVAPPTTGVEVADAPATDGGWQQPTPGAPVTSGFGYRVHPTLGYKKLHEGVDFGAACGTQVHAAQSGTVIAAEYNPTSGNRVKLQHADGLITDYYHLTDYTVSTGDTVTKGETVGHVGSTGRSTGCHLHFGLEQGEGNYINPMTLWQ